MSFLFEKDDEYKKYLRDRVFEESDDNDTKMEKLEKHLPIEGKVLRAIRGFS